MIICDTSGLYSLYNKKQPHHQPVKAFVEGYKGPLLMSHYVLTETDYFVRTGLGVKAGLGFLDDIRRGVFRVDSLRGEEFDHAISLIRKYSSHNLGLADAANIILAARFRTNRLLTLDERDYRAVKPLWGDAFQLVPLDRDS